MTLDLGERPTRENARNQDAVTMTGEDNLPLLLTTEEVAALLRTTRKAIYAMLERGLLPGVTRVGRRVLFRRNDLLDWLRQKRAPLPKE